MKKLFTFSFALMLSVVTVFAQSEWCSKQLWHDLPYGSTPKANANTESLALFSVQDNGDGTITFTIAADPENTAHSDIDFILINPMALSAGTDVDNAADSQSSLSVNYTVPDGTSELTLEVLWSYAGWPGRWMTQQMTVNLADICSEGSEPVVAEPVFEEDAFITWSDTEAADYKQNTTFGKLIVLAGDSVGEDNKDKKHVTVDANNKKYKEDGEDHNFTHRLKLNGTGNKNFRTMKANVKGACTINLYLLSGSSSGSDRYINVDINEFAGTAAEAVHAAQIAAPPTFSGANGSNVAKGSYHYEGTEPATIYLYSQASGINIYGFEVVYDAVEDDCPATITECLVSDITATSVRLEFDGSECNRGGDIYNGSKIIASITGPEVVIPGLTPETTYNLTAIAYNENGVPSEVFNVPAFTTLAEGALGDNLALNKPTVAGYEADHNAFGAALATDGNLGSRWGSNGAQHYASAGENAQDWIYVDLGGLYDINLIRLYYETASPSDYDILVSNNGLTWTVIATYTEAAPGSNDGSAYMDYNVTAQGRYVKIFVRNGYADLTWGVSIWELEVYGTAAVSDDNVKPVMGTASVVQVGMDNAIIHVEGATDDNAAGVVGYRVTYHTETDEISNIYSADASGNITVIGLTGGRTYRLYIAAIDAAGNVSDNDAVVEFNTTADITRPWTAPAEPTFAPENVINIFSGAYPAPNPAWSFGNGWYHGARFSIVNIDGNEVQLYQDAPADGLTGAQIVDFDGSEMTHIYFDFWAQEAGTIVFKLVTHNDANQNIDLNSQPINVPAGWSVVDLVIADVFPTANLAKVFQFGLVTPSMANFALDNILLYKVAGSETALDMIQNTGIRYFNGMLYNQNNVRMEVFNVNGQKVADTTSDLDMNAMANGVYMVRANKAILKIVK